VRETAWTICSRFTYVPDNALYTAPPLADALTDTLIIDGEGVYDPRQVNDRLLLGLKGTMSEFELSLFRQRAREAFEMKVAAGHAMWEVPVGFTRDERDRVEKIADREVQAAIESVFRKARELGAARQTALWFRDNKTPLPSLGLALERRRSHRAFGGAHRQGFELRPEDSRSQILIC
jgi:DNA invertase Pin-like site-specific DNA recombinase